MADCGVDGTSNSILYYQSLAFSGYHTYDIHECWLHDLFAGISK